MEDNNYTPEENRSSAILLISPKGDNTLQPIVALLEESAFRCVQHADALEAVEIASQMLPDAIVIDGEIAGIKPAEAGKVLKSKLPFVPLILWTADMQDTALRQCLERSGFDLCIDKRHPPPVFLGQLRAMLRSTHQIKQLMESNRRLNRLSVSDPLTGLFNHKHLLDWLHIEFKRSERNLEPLSSIMIDIDHFKSVNDTYGHKFGDFVLKEFASIIESNIRKIDILGRYGGEEFLVILPNTDLFGAINLAEKLRKVIECYSFKEGAFETALTASFGVSSTSDERILRADHLLQMSDKALFIGKESGRNRVCSPDEVKAQEDTLHNGRRGHFDIQGRVVHVLSTDGQRHERLGEMLAAAGLRAIDTATPQEFNEAIRRYPCDILVFDDTVSSEACEEIAHKVHNYDQHFSASLILVSDDPANFEQASRAIPDELGPALTCVPEAFLIPTIQSHIDIRALQADLRESNTRLRIAQRKLIRSERLKALGEMSSGVAHDLNNVLGIILGRAQYLKGKTSEAFIHASLEIIEKSALDGAQTLRRILEFFRPEAPMNIEPLNVKALVHNCLEFTKVRWRDEANLKSLRYQIDLDVDEELTILGSESELSEVLINLIFNALDAMPEGGALTLGAKPAIEDEFCLEVNDTGIGMTEQVMEKIFDPFFTTKKDKGTGLGMSVVSNIISRHSGRIEVDSKPGIGSTFRLYLPQCQTHTPFDARETVDEAAVAREASHDKALAEAGPESAAENFVRDPDAETLRILLVDDEGDILEVFHAILTEAGYEVERCNDGQHAMDLFAIRPFDILVTDLGMPGLSGWDVARGAREMYPQVVIILTSGWGDDSSKALLNERGIDYALPKPVRVDSLLKMIKRIEAGLVSRNKQTAQ